MIRMQGMTIGGSSAAGCSKQLKMSTLATIMTTMLVMTTGRKKQ